MSEQLVKPILALNSIRGKSGKDTLIEHIESSLGLRVFRVAFADILKKECARILTDSDNTAACYLRWMHSAEKDTAFPSLAIDGLPDSDYLAFLVRKGTPRTREYLSCPRSLRWHLQQYGTEYVREHLGRPNEWLNKGVRQCLIGAGSPNHDLIVVADLRLPNEHQMMVKLGAKTIRIVRNWFIPGVDDVPFHQSDIALMAHPFDALVVNEWGNPAAMVDPIKEFLK